MRTLGYRGHQVLDFVRSSLAVQGDVPSYGAIRDALGFSANADVCRVVARLERRAMSQAEIDALPRRYKLIAVERGTLRALNDGSYVAWPDASMMGEDELQAHRERVQQLIADGLL